MNVIGAEKVALWYAIGIRSKYEKKSFEQLRSKGVDAYLPLIEEMHIWSDRRKKVIEPLFRGYLFVKTDLQNRIDILQTDGVIRFIGSGNRPTVIPEEQMEWVRTAAGQPSTTKRESYPALGERVMVVAGALQGVQGIIIRIKDSYRLVVSVECICQCFSVDVPPDVVQRVWA